MLIVNPLYDQAFKYLMDNEAIAKKILSVIIEQEIAQLEVKPQETVSLEKKREMPILRFDFKAVIRSDTGEQYNVLIEIQKSKSPDPIIRFRRYLGKNYLRKETYIDSKGTKHETALPIITIYFLGYNLPEYETPGILVNNTVTDAITKQPLEKKAEFVKMLTHPSYILQINRLRKERKTRLEKLLSIFDQSQQTEDKYLLDIEMFTELKEFEDIIKYLNRASQDEEFIRQLELEEEIEAEFEKKDNELREAKQIIEKERKFSKEKEKTIEEKDKKLEEKDKYIQELLKKLKD